MARVMDFVALGDTHARHEQIHLPPSALVIFTGDALDLFSAKSETDLWTQLQSFAAWLNARAQSTIFVPGNHDLVFQLDQDRARAILGESVHVLIDESIIIDGVKIYGSPWQPIFMPDQAFTLERDDPALAAHWDAIPQDTDLLLTHTPPQGVGDFNGRAHVGDAALTSTLTERVHPSLHLFGHIHGAWAAGSIGPTPCLNVSSFDADWTPRPPQDLSLLPHFDHLEIL
jgi:Icc-related predicted phosphoesterase